MRMIRKMLRRALLLPILPIIGAQGETSSAKREAEETLLSPEQLEQLREAVRERTQRAERAVLRDYFEQCGIAQERQEQAGEIYREYCRGEEAQLSARLHETERSLSEERTAARQARSRAEARVQMALLGVGEQSFADVYALAREEIEAACEGENPDSALVRAAVEKALERAGAMLSHTREVQLPGTGSAGRFPRADVLGSYAQQLKNARARSDNAAAAAIISRAAAEGISLR